MMQLAITNKDALDTWMKERMRMGRDMSAIKGQPPEGTTYSDGEPIVRPINIAWRDETTGEVFAIEYSLVEGDK